MDAIRFGLGVRALRRRRGWRQADLAMRAGVSRSVISRVERGGADRVTPALLERIVAPLGARVDLRLRWQGEAVDRLLDAEHAALVEHVLRLLRRLGWEARPEVTFAIRGERGSIDILAWHGPTASLLVIEVKSVVPDLQAMLAALDRKARLAPSVALEEGWRPATVSRLLVLPADRTSRRRVSRHAATFERALPARTRDVTRWLRKPDGVVCGVSFTAHRVPSRHRVAPARPRAPADIGRDARVVLDELH